MNPGGNQSDDRSDSPPSPEYPEGPITCCVYALSKEARLLKHRKWTVSLMISIVSVCVSLVLFLVAFGTTGWVRVRKMDVDPHRIDLVGLWQECLGGECSAIAGDITGAGFKTSQAFAVICLLMIMVGGILTFQYSFAQLKQVRKTGKIAVFVRFFSFFMLLFLIPVFAATWDKDHQRYDKSIYDGDLHFSFKMVAATFVMEAIGAFFLYVEVFVILPRRTRPLIKNRNMKFYDGINNEGFSELPDMPGASGVFPGDGGFGPTRHRQPRLEEQVMSRMNAQAAYENFAFNHDAMQISGAGVAGPLMDSGLVGRSTEDIAKRFVGIVLAEPQYTPSKHTPSASMAARRMSIDSTREPVPIQQSVSMQNVFNENLSVVQPNPDNMMVTSVSMYNLNQQPEKPYENHLERQTGERDRFSMQSWHPERDSTPNNLYVDRTVQSQSVNATLNPRDLEYNTGVSLYQEANDNADSGARQKQYQKHNTPSHDHTAPTQRKKKRKSKKAAAAASQGQSPQGNLSRATSNMSLTSVATSVVSGCAETEI